MRGLDRRALLVVARVVAELERRQRDGDRSARWRLARRSGDGDRRIPIIFWVQRLDPDRYFDTAFKAQLKD